MGTNTQSSRAGARDVFCEAGLRCTRQRLAVYDALRDARNHPSAEELYQLVRDTAGGLSRATVYNTLDVLCRHGLARQLPTTNGICRYDADTSNHVHIRHIATSRIEDVPGDLADRVLQSIPTSILQEIEHTMGVRIASINLQLAAKPKPEER